MKHLSNDELVNLVYGVGTNGHLDDCRECAERFEQLREKRALAAGAAAGVARVSGCAAKEYLCADGREAAGADEVGAGAGRRGMPDRRRRIFASPGASGNAAKRLRYMSMRNCSPMYTRWSNRWSRSRRSRFMRCSSRISSNFMLKWAFSRRALAGHAVARR